MTTKIIPTALLAITLSHGAHAELVNAADSATITIDSVYTKKWIPSILSNPPSKIHARAGSIYICRNTVEIIDGKYLYTASHCTGQALATQIILDIMTFNANDPRSFSSVAPHLYKSLKHKFWVSANNRKLQLWLENS